MHSRHDISSWLPAQHHVLRGEARAQSHQHRGIYDAIVSSGQLSEDTVTSLEHAIGDFKKTFETSTGEALNPKGEWVHQASATSAPYRC